MGEVCLEVAYTYARHDGEDVDFTASGLSAAFGYRLTLP
jgi:hypothetical protein